MTDRGQQSMSVNAHLYDIKRQYTRKTQHKEERRMFGFKNTREEINHYNEQIERGQAELRKLPARHVDRSKHERWIDKAQDHVQNLEKTGKCNADGCR